MRLTRSQFFRWIVDIGSSIGVARHWSTRTETSVLNIAYVLFCDRIIIRSTDTLMLHIESSCEMDRYE